MRISVGGVYAAQQDFSQVLTAKMPQFIAVVVGLAFVLLAIVFRSLLDPPRGVGHEPPFLRSRLGGHDRCLPVRLGEVPPRVRRVRADHQLAAVIMFAILFGLSMDYQVFLVSRMHEEWRRRGDNEQAVITGQAETGRVITAAALIMILVFASFMFGGELAIKQIGLGFAAAIFVDAFIIRTVLVPAIMHMLGRANWWLPAPANRPSPASMSSPPSWPSHQISLGPVRPAACKRLPTTGIDSRKCAKDEVSPGKA